MTRTTKNWIQHYHVKARGIDITIDDLTVDKEGEAMVEWEKMVGFIMDKTGLAVLNVSETSITFYGGGRCWWTPCHGYCVENRAKGNVPSIH